MHGDCVLRAARRVEAVDRKSAVVAVTSLNVVDTVFKSVKKQRIDDLRKVGGR